MIKAAKLLYLIFIACFLGLPGVLLGYDTSIIYSSATIFLRDFNLDAIQSNWLISTLLVGAAIGALTLGKITDKFGRKKGLVLSGILFIFGTISVAIANSILQLFIFSFILSLAIGIVSFAIPNYIAEISPPNLRGRLVTIFQLFITIGVLATFVLNHYMFTMHLSWRIIFASGSILAIIFFIGTLILPESPRWLILCGRDSEATKALIKLHGNNYHVELAEMKSAIAKEQRAKTLVTKTNLQVILIAVILNLFSAFCGISTVVYHTYEIFSGLGIKIHPLHIYSVN